MKSQTRVLAFTALSVAGAVVMLYLGMFFPALALTFAALAALFVTTAVIEGGLRYGLYSAVATALIGLLLMPTQPVFLLYLIFFGFYPLVKSAAERQKSQILGWAIKYAVFFAALTLYLTLLQELLLGTIPFDDQALPFIYLSGALVFLVYDLGMSKLIGFYLSRIYKYREGR